MGDIKKMFNPDAVALIGATDEVGTVEFEGDVL
jgi:acyl-CoA synthetase (NDP forming)